MHYKFKTKPFAHQLKALEMSWDKKVFAYFMEMGTGKSKVLIDNMSMLYDKGLINGALIIAPKGVYKNWFDSEIPNHMADHIEKKMVLWESTASKSKEKELNILFKSDHDLHILIMNVEALSTKKGKQFAYTFLNCHKALMAIDESTTIKNPGAIRTKNIIGLATVNKRNIDGSIYRNIVRAYRNGLPSRANSNIRFVSCKQGIFYCYISAIANINESCIGCSLFTFTGNAMFETFYYNI